MKSKRKRSGAKPASRQRAKSPKEGYDVGYARPPKETRFQSGQSGNPRGRPRGSRNYRAMFKEGLTAALDTLVPVRVGGREPEQFKMITALAYGIVTRATKDPRAARDLLALLDELGISKVGDENAEQGATTEEQWAEVDRIMEEMATDLMKRGYLVPGDDGRMVYRNNSSRLAVRMPPIQEKWARIKRENEEFQRRREAGLPPKRQADE